MPRIPIYSDNKVSPSSVPSVQQNLRLSQRDAADISGATTIAQVSNGLNEIGDVLAQMRERDDDAKVLEQSSIMSTAVAQHHADLSRLKGADASSISEKNEEFWKKYESESLGKLTPAQRTKFQGVLVRAKTSSRESAIKTQVAEENRYYDSTLVAGIESATQAASLNPLDIDNVKMNADLVKMYVGKQLARQGLKDEAADAHVRGVMTDFHTAIVSGMIEKDANAAKGYYYSNIKEIGVKDRERIEKALETGGRAQRAQEAADAMMQLFGDEAEGLAHIEKNYSGEDEIAVKREYQSRMQDARRIGAAEQKQTLSKLALEIETKGAGSLSRLMRTKDYMSLDDEHKLALQNIADTRVREARADARAERVAAGGGMTLTERKQLEKEANYEAMVELARTNPAAFKEVDLNLHSSKLTADMREDLKTVQKNMTEGGGKELTEAQMLGVATDLGKAAGLSSGKVFKLRAAMREQIEAEQLATGKPLTRKRVRDITNELLTEGKTEGLFFDSSARRFDVPAGKTFIRKDKSTGARLLTDVPEGDRAEIEAELRKRGMKVTTESIINLYNRANKK